MRSTVFVAVLALAPWVARADEPKVDVNADVVLASTQGDVIDPPSLAAMKEKFAKKIRYTSLKRISAQKLSLTRSTPAQVKLPNKKTATLSLDELKNGIARVRVKLPPSDTVYSLGREGSLYLDGGDHEGADLWLVLAPAK